MRIAMTGGVLAAALLAGAAQAQDNSTTTVPAPGIERYSLPPGTGQASPAPTPTPTSAPVLTPAAPPSVVPTLTLPQRLPSPSPTRSAPATRPAPTQTSPRTAATPVPVATPVSAPTADVVETTTPAPTSSPVESDPASEAQPSGMPDWLWWAIGLAVIVVAGAFAWRRFGRVPVEALAEPDEVQPPPPAAPTPSPPARPIAPSPSVQSDRALVLDFRPQRLWTRGPDAHLAFELVVTNSAATPADAVRPVIALASAGPDTAAEIAAFTANAPTMPGGEPFALRAGETRSIAGELTLPGDAMYVTSAGERELIVPLALVSLQWRAGLSLARANEAFVIGTGDATAPKLGPIWVDRAGLVYAKLDARRFTPGPIGGR